MTRRKPHNMQARMGRALGAILRSNSVAVVNLDPSGRQGMVNWKNCKNIPPSRRIADAVPDARPAGVAPSINPSTFHANGEGEL